MLRTIIATVTAATIVTWLALLIAGVRLVRSRQDVQR